MEPPAIDEGGPPTPAELPAAHSGRAGDCALRTSTAVGRGIGRGVTRSPSGRFRRALPADSESLADMDSVSTILASSHATESAEASAQNSGSIASLEGATATLSGEATSTPFSQEPGPPIDTAQTAPSTPSVEDPTVDRRAPSINSAPQVCAEDTTSGDAVPSQHTPAGSLETVQDSSACHDSTQTAQLPPRGHHAGQAKTPQPTLPVSTATPAAPLPTAACAPPSPSHAASRRAVPGSANKTPTRNRKGKQKRRHSASDSPTHPSATEESQPQRRKAAKSKPTPEPINTSLNATGSPLTAPVPPRQLFGPTAPAPASESDQYSVWAPQALDGHPYSAQPAFAVPQPPPVAGPSSGPLWSANLANIRNPSRVRPQPTQAQRLQGWWAMGQAPAEGQYARMEELQLFWDQFFAEYYLDNSVGIGGQNAPFTAPPLLNAGTFAQQQGQPPLANDFQLPLVPMTPNMADLGLLPPAGVSQTHLPPMPQTAGPAVPGQGFAQFQNQVLPGTYYLPSYGAMASNPAMQSNDNLSPWNRIAAYRNANGQHGSASTSPEQGPAPFATGPAAASSNPQPAFQHYGAQSTQGFNATDVLDIFDDPDVRAVFELFSDDNHAQAAVPTGTDPETLQTPDDLQVTTERLLCRPPRS